MTTTSRGKTTRATQPVRRRRKSNSLGSFMLWAFFSWLFAKTGHRGPMNPYARPSDQPTRRRTKVKRSGGGGGGGAPGVGHGTPAKEGPKQPKAPLDTDDGPDDGGFFSPKRPPVDEPGPDDGGFFPDDKPADDDADGGDSADDAPQAPEAPTGFEPTSDGAV